MPTWQIILLALTLIFIATTILGRRYSNLWLRLVYRISAIWLGVLNYSFFAAVAAWIFSAAAAMLSFHIEPKLMAATFFGGAMVTSIYGLVNAFWLRVTRVTVKLANLPANWRGCNVALVGRYLLVRNSEEAACCELPVENRLNLLAVLDHGGACGWDSPASAGAFSSGCSR